MKQYKVIKYKNTYKLIDILPIEMDISFRGESNEIHVTKDKKVYLVHHYEVVDDWYADIGYVTHFEKSKEYLGRLVFESDNIEEAALKFAELGGKYE